MASCRCKMCGGQIIYDSNQTTATCEFCGTEQTVVCADDTKKANLHNRANSLRLINEFDKALATYETILIDNPKDAEAHWGICLCRYGIEYVDDPKTKKKIPTCHRTVYNSIFDDIDYKEAITNCDVIAKRIYQSEAEIIDKIQKTILSISQKEDPYDIFICYKETDENGNRTKDSVIAQEIYDALTEKGYKVFFARITLESKLGTQYEPIIFAALQSSKVMLAIGSKIEYYNAPWVKNEWSRFLSFMKEQRGKYLIPCYKDMEAYDMPDEFLSLQAQNIDKLGFLQDLVRGIDKIFGRKDKKIEQNISINTTTNSKYLNLLKRAKLSIEDREYKKASSLIEEVLNENAECAEAYVALILIEFELVREDDLMNLSEPLDQNKNFIKALRFADEKYKNKLVSYNEQIKNKIDLANKEKIYLSGKNLVNQKRYNEAITIFESIKGYKDSEDLIEYCTLQIQSDIYSRAMNYFNAGSYDLAHQEFSRIIQYKDSELFIERCKQLSEEKRKEGIYNTAISKIEFVLSNAKETIDESSFKVGINLLKDIIDFKDSNERIIKYEKRLAELKEKIAKEKEEKRKEAERIALLKKEKEEKERIERINRGKIRKDKFKRFLKFFIPSATLLTIVLVLIFTLFIPLAKYNNAMDLINTGKYDEAEIILDELDDFKDAQTQIKLMEAREYFENGNYESGIDLVYEVGGEVKITYNTDGGSSEKEHEVIKKLKRVENDCEKPGYEFYGWLLEDFTFSNNNYTVDLILKASYEIVTFNLSFDFNGGSKEIYPETYTVISEDIIVSNPTRKGYTFVGWTMGKTDEPVKDLVIKTGSVGDREYTAHWEANTYKITYDWNMPEEYLTYQDVVYDSQFTLLTPERKGYQFLGWLDENNHYFEEGYYIIDKNIRLTAQWKLIDYKLTFDFNGGNIEGYPATYNCENEDIIVNNPTRKGYTFIGWTLEETDEPVKDLVIKTGSVDDREYTAHWEANTYKITYDWNTPEEYLTYQDVVYDSQFTLLTTERKGYQFVGWLDENNYYFEEGYYTIDKNIRLTAQWELIEYNISYVMNGGTNNANAPSTYNYESDTIILNEPIKNGYTFIGWTGENYDEPTLVVEIPAHSINNRTYTAHWEANEYTITYDVNGDDSLETIEYEYIFDVSYILPTPEREGYNFAGWYYGEQLVEDGIWKISENCELVARWAIIEYNIYYELNGGVNDSNNPSTYNYDCEDIVFSSPTRTGYTFVGWTLEDTDKPIKDLVIKTGSVGDREYTAHWEANEYTITYDVNGGDLLDDNEQIVIFDSAYELKTPTRSGYTFAGWYYNGSEFENGLWEIDDNVILVAHWEIITYYITYNLDGGVNDSNNPSTYNYDCEDIVLSSPTRTGYTFVGWTSASQTTPTLDLFLPHNSTQDKTITAHWEANEYTIIYDVNGGDLLDDNEQIVIFDSAYKLKTPTRSGYTFAGWYYNGSEFENGLWEIDDNVILVAHWEIITYYITYNLDGGVNDSNNPSTYNYDCEDIVLSSPIREGYTFIGWTSLTSNTPTIGPIIEQNSTGNKMFTAHWEANEYTITYDVNGGDLLDDNEQIVIFDSAYELKTPTRTGYTFVGWYYNDTIISNVGSWDIADNCKLEAKWEANTYIITIITSSSNKTYVATYDSNFTLSTQSKYGYYFDGYYLEQYGKGTKITDSKGASIIPFTYTENITVYTSFIYEVDFVSNGGEEIETVTYHENEFLDSTIVTTKEGKTFGGWYTNSKLTTQVSYSSSLGNKTLYAKWEEEVLPTELTYNVANNSITITDSAYSGTTLILPSHIGGIKVETLGDKAFENMTSLTKVEVPDTVETIGDGAFKGCNALTDITIPFVGRSMNETSTKYQVFGHIFGYYDYSSSDFLTSNSGYSYTSQGISHISSGGYTYRYHYYIPESIRNVTITSQEVIPVSAFRNCDLIETIQIPTTTTSIGDYAFYNCKNVVSYNGNNDGKSILPATLVNISNYTFYNNSSLQAVELSNEIETICNYAFSGCTNITEITANSTISSLIEIGDYAFHNCKNVDKYFNSNSDEIIIPSGVKTIGTNAFYGNTIVTKVEVSDTVETIGDGAFKGCNALTDITIPFVGRSMNETSTKYQVFGHIFGYYDYSSSDFLTSNSGYSYTSQGISHISSGGYTYRYHYYIPESIRNVTITSQEVIPVSAFRNCDLIETIQIPTTTTSIGDYAFFNCTKLSGLNENSTNESVIPQNIKTISQYAFYNNDSLTIIRFLGDIEMIDKHAFYGCLSLSEVYFESNIKTINDYAFYGCLSLSEVYFESNIKTINDYAFYGCSNIVRFGSDKAYELIVPDSCESIGSYAFANLNKLKYVTIPDSVTTIGSYVFGKMTSLEELTIPFIPYKKDTVGIGYMFINSASTIDGMYLAGAYNYSSDDDYRIPSSLRKITISSATDIPNYAFYNMTSLVEIYLPDTLNSIAQYSFYGCKNLSQLNSDRAGVIVLPKNIDTIEKYSFYNCSSIAETYFESNIKTINDYVFYGCSNLVRFGSDKAYELIVPDSCETIGSYAFANLNKLKYVTIPDSVTTIGSYVFGKMTSLEELTIPFIPYKKDTVGIGYLFINSDSSIDGMYLAGAYNYSSDDDYRVPSSLRKITISSATDIPNYAFYKMTSLVEVDLPNSLTQIGKYAFYNCKSLSNLNSQIEGVMNLPNKIVEIPNYCFYNCVSIAEVYMPNNVEVIGSYSFAECVNIVRFNTSVPYELLVPDSCETIGSYAFANLKLIKKVVITNSVTSIGERCFSSMIQLEELTIPFVKDFAESKVGIGYLFSYSSSSITGMYSGGAYSSYYKVPNTLSTINITRQEFIPDYAFYNMTKLTNINLRTNVTSSSNSFKNCSASINYILENPIYYDDNTVWDGITYANNYAVGNGTKEDPYIISNSIEFYYFVTQINNGNNYSNTYFKLVNDIDLNKMNFESMKEFNGYFDGNGYTIKNINLMNSNEYCGLFHILGENGYIVNLRVKFASIKINDDLLLKNYVGPLVALNNGTIKNCLVEGTITVSVTNELYVGGIVGYNNGSIINSYSNVLISSTSSISYSYAGGIVGYNNGTVIECLSINNVSSKGFTIAYSFVGGIAGSTISNGITNSYFMDTQILTKYESNVIISNNNETVINISEIDNLLPFLWDVQYWDFDYQYPKLIQQ